MQKKEKTRRFKEKWGRVRDLKIAKEREADKNWALTRHYSWRKFYERLEKKRANHRIRQLSKNDFRYLRGTYPSWRYYEREWFLRSEDVKNLRLYLSLFEEEIVFTHYEWLNGDEENPLFVDLRDRCPDYKLLENSI